MRNVLRQPVCRFLKLSAPFLAQVESAKGTDVANLNHTGGRQILLSNRVLERAFFGEEPRELCLGALTASHGLVRGKRLKVLSCQGWRCQHKRHHNLLTLIRADKGMYENRKSPLPCRNAVRHVHGGKWTPHRCGSALSCLCQGDVRRWLQREEVKPGQVAEPHEVRAGGPWLGPAFVSGWEQVAERWAGGERGLFSVSLVIAGCLM